MSRIQTTGVRLSSFISRLGRNLSSILSTIGRVHGEAGETQIHGPRQAYAGGFELTI
jgi:hypothetical protein